MVTRGLSSQPKESATLELAPQDVKSTTGEHAHQPRMSAANPQSSNTGEQPQFRPSDAVDLDRQDF
jgi:hypothetical protein